MARKAMAKKKISEFKPQRKNANKHTARGLGMLDKSMSDHGFFGAMTSAADGEIFDGSARLETAYERFGEDVEPIIVEADGTRPIIVKRIDIPSADDPRAKKMAIAANRIAAVDLDWDADVLASIADEVDISDMFFEDELARLVDEDAEMQHREVIGDNDADDIENDDKNDQRFDDDQVAVPDMYFPSNNEWDIPLLDINMQAKYLDLPLHGWGTISRKARNASQTIHFYVDDYRFNAIWKNPEQLIDCNPINVIEPNFTTSHGMGRAMILWLTFKKRWIARYWQTHGIRVFVDAFAPDFEDINFMGVPHEWGAFATRYLGVNPSGDIGGWEQVEATYAKCREYSTAEKLIFVVVGGRKDIEAKCAERGWFHVLEFNQKLDKDKK